MGAVSGVVGNWLARRAIAAELRAGIDRDGADESVRRAERTLAGGLVRHAAAVAPAGRKDAIRVDAKVFFDLRHDGIGKLQVRIARIRPAASGGLRTVLVALLPVRRDENRRIAG